MPKLTAAEKTLLSQNSPRVMRLIENRPYCKHCQGTLNISKQEHVLKKLPTYNLRTDETISLLPICSQCIYRYSLYRAEKYHDDHNINSLCIWIKMANVDANTINIEKYGSIFTVTINKKTMRLPQVSTGGYPIPPGYLFDKLNEMLG